MITSKYIAVITTALMCLSLLACGLIVYAAHTFESIRIPEYQEKLFGDETLTIDIQVDKDDWQSVMDNATAKEWVSGDLIINGERFSNIGIRTKGNSSLTQGASSDSDRYSLQFKFDHYVKGQTCHGLDTFCVNNLMGDATYMKDVLSYEIMKYAGVETPLTNYASVTVNGEDYGFCVALERYDKAFLDRVYNTSGGQLYNVKIQMGMRGDFEDMRQDSGVPDRQPGEMDTEAVQSAEGNVEARQPGGGMGRGFGGQSGGGSLVYTDDEFSSYASIFDNAVFNKNSDQDKQRVITAIKNLNQGSNLERYFDVDAILRYFAAHTILVNLDSYSSNMQQNYYIYERDGKLTILPWDYGLAFGGFQSGDASSVVNFPIDTPVSGVSMEDRPLLNKLLEVDEYHEKYHTYLRQIVEGYFESGLFEDKIYELDAKIGVYVEHDVSAYFTYEQYQASLPVLAELGRLRAESVKGQLDGAIPSTSEGQKADVASLTDAADIDLSALGSMMGGGGGQRGQMGGQDGATEGQGGRPGGWGGDMPDMEMMRQAMQILMEAGGELTDEVKAALTELGVTEEQMEMLSNMQNGRMGGNRGQNGFPNGENALPGGSESAANAPQGIGGGMGVAAAQAVFDPEYAIVIGVLLILLAGAIIFVAKPRKHVI